MSHTQHRRQFIQSLAAGLAYLTLGSESGDRDGGDRKEIAGRISDRRLTVHRREQA
jgi:hypothetical protein